MAKQQSNIGYLIVLKYWTRNAINSLDPARTASRERSDLGLYFFQFFRQPFKQCRIVKPVTVIILNIGTDRSEQTVQTQISMRNLFDHQKNRYFVR